MVFCESCSPCFCISLQNGCKIVAVLQIIWGSSLLIFSAFGVIGLLYATSAVDEDELNIFLGDISVARLFSGVMVCGSLTVIFARLLWIGVRDKKAGKVRVWIYVNFAVFLFFLGSCWCFGIGFKLNPIWSESIAMVLLAIHFYFILVGYSFMRGVHQEKEQMKMLPIKLCSLELENV